MEKQNSAISDDSKSNHKVKLMCSYGGKIQPRSHDHHLTYVGGETKILAVDRRIKFSDIVAKLMSLSKSNAAAADDVVSFKYQLPGEDLDALVSVINDDDLEHMMAEYDRMHAISSKPARLRLFLFSPNRRPIHTGLDRTKTKMGSTLVPSSTELNPDFLFGFDKEYDYQKGSGMVRPDMTGLDSRNGAEIQARVQSHGLHETFPREGHVSSLRGQVVYRIPVVAGGGYQGGGGQCGMPPPVRMVPGFVYREQPGYNGVGSERGGVCVAADHEGGRSEGYDGVGVASPHPTVTMSPTFFGDGKNNI